MRYDRQMILPEIGEDGQQKLKQAKVLIVGVGGLGSPIALYLTGAGVGCIGLVDDDVVSISNLQRQVLYSEKELGKPQGNMCRRTTFRTKQRDNYPDLSNPFDGGKRTGNYQSV